VVSECRVNDQGIGARQELHIRRGNCDPVRISYCLGGSEAGRVCRVDDPGACPGGTCGGLGRAEDDPVTRDACRTFAESRYGDVSPVGSLFQRLGVSPDGSTVVFELGHLGYFSQLFYPDIEPVTGIYAVQADGSRLRRIGDASCEGHWDAIIVTGPKDIPPCPDSFRGSDDTKGFPALFAYLGFNFSPNGETVVLTDLGPGDGGDAFQVFTLDLRTGRRRQLTRRAPAPNRLCFLDGTEIPRITGRSRPGPTPQFLDKDTILYFAPEGGEEAGPCVNGERDLMPEGRFRTITTNGRKDELVASSLPEDVSEDPQFRIVGGTATVLTLRHVHEEARNNICLESNVREVYVLHGTKDLLQLTNFDREDLDGAAVGIDGQRVFFSASANPDTSTCGNCDNDTYNCQLFSIGVHGRGLRQLTRFRELDESGNPLPSRNGCGASRKGEGCGVGRVYQDRETRTLLFASDCDPFGTNPYGYQVFAMRPDGSRLRQLTHARGTTGDPASSSFGVELPGPWAYPGVGRP
jgi:hypothetical protein